MEKGDIIIFDTDYSPIKGGMVSFKVDSEVVSQKRAEEKLTLTIGTNGVVQPKKALQEVLETSRNSFEMIANLISNKKKEKPTTEVN
jgi:DNA-directed RNA polymerase alpha subunit